MATFHRNQVQKNVVIINFKISHICTLFIMFIGSKNVSFLVSLVCIDVKFDAVDIKVNWKIGSCYSGSFDTNYYGEKSNTKRCCLSPGEYTLICNSETPYNWRQNSLEIQGRRYCNDFKGLRALRRINIFGKNRTQLH